MSYFFFTIPFMAVLLILDKAGFAIHATRNSESYGSRNCWRFNLWKPVSNPALFSLILIDLSFNHVYVCMTVCVKWCMQGASWIYLILQYFFLIWITDNGRRTVHGRAREEIGQSDGGEWTEGGDVIKGQTKIHIQQRKNIQGIFKL